ncbi:CBS domain-containing protein [Nocardioides lianchengensis]|uniref:CBS domain-containing protein n=1 Tax=Nocardioides lianchengensis TaxID=1045774 RepID=A0A1G6YK62_9ACTN|nr:CBS domain-containing protein [Nocardioides lianchengensis]NYG09614.1 CBS-domain-containing membrane protein [Nocardioides lianchengensis]SDD90779.1 CBS domain-containing protein [Nocardioides lianchengensis]
MLVTDVMTREVVTVRRDATVKETLGLLASYRVTALPVVDDDGRLVGVVSEADLIRESVPSDPRTHLGPLPAAPHPPRRVDEVFTPRPVTVRPYDDLAVAVELMTTTSVKSLPVVDELGRVAGVVARSDVVRMLARADGVIEAELDDTYRSLGHPDWLVTVTDGSVEVVGPMGGGERSLAEVVARTVPGVVEVRVG